ncbi:hypothetical protein [Micromonospora sp. WMMC273]|uniref:hypothetical protein n=1 Tax=Micromonospora sp. WMMC273 TaxID=3015157 RepID=UPI0022B6FB6F|nr:hypothetical protein [Micromonospora sp. WMMC273]MCZ7478832.1 hypothetical protein [Micromonospora sp. WMMC273]MCZ7478960.1 hypothetical protein [Micromonospora sp. WMMC273]MCZ7479008.1 hypothetical protein [Micromonospora sp. WMMC273]
MSTTATAQDDQPAPVRRLASVPTTGRGTTPATVAPVVALPTPAPVDGRPAAVALAAPGAPARVLPLIPPARVGGSPAASGAPTVVMPAVAAPADPGPALALLDLDGRPAAGPAGNVVPDPDGPRLTVVQAPPERPASDPAPCGLMTQWIGQVCQDAGQPLSLTITGQLHTIYVHLPTAEVWQAWCARLATDHKTVTHDQLVGGMLTGVVFTHGWTIHVQLLGRPAAVAGGQP